MQYAEHQEDREKIGAKLVESGIRNKLVEQAIEMFGIKDKFDVPKQTIHNRIHAERLKVWHPGTKSSLLEVEVILISFIHTAHRLCCPLDVGDVIALMNALISGTFHKKRVIAWKRTHCSNNEDSPLVGRKWFQNFRERNPELWLQKARKYACNREDHCNFVAFRKMYDQCEEGLVALGNVVRYDCPVHYNQVGKIVDDETLASGHPVTIKYLRPENVFFWTRPGITRMEKMTGNEGVSGKLFQRGKF